MTERKVVADVGDVTLLSNFQIRFLPSFSAAAASADDDDAGWLIATRVYNIIISSNAINYCQSLLDSYTDPQK